MSGGSCSTTGLRERLTKELQKRVDKRYNETQAKSKLQSKPIEINVHESPYDNFAVWNGGSMIAISVSCNLGMLISRTNSQSPTTQDSSTSRMDQALPDTTRSSLREFKKDAFPRELPDESRPRNHGMRHNHLQRQFKPLLTGLVNF